MRYQPAAAGVAREEVGRRRAASSTTASLGAASADSAPSDDRFRLHAAARPHALDGFLFYLRLPFRVRTQIRDFRPDAIFASDPVRRGGRARSAERSPAAARP